MTPQPSVTRATTAPVITTTNPPQLKFKLAKQRPLYFKARLTQFDLSNTDKSNDAFRGFYTLFWIAMGLYVITAVVRCYEQEGILLSLGFFRLFSKDGWGLLMSDLFMVSMTTFSVLFSKLLIWNVIRYETFGCTIQHVCQICFLATSIYWTFFK
jgi:sterol O-acyltransferase